MTSSTLLAPAILVVLFLVSCGAPVIVVQHDVAGSAWNEMVVSEQPPAPEKEAIPAAPSPDHLWVEGYWTHCYNGWVWVPGCHVLRPREHTVWVSGYWERHPRGWIWIHGHWS